ncbi:MAG TPA: C1 family peptidase [Bacteroidales bacterium]|nr:C1 family peptidase [Bacteroidales bacterium]
MKKFTLYCLLLIVLSSGFLRFGYNTSLFSDDLYSKEKQSNVSEYQSQDVYIGYKVNSGAKKSLDKFKIYLVGKGTSALVNDYQLPVLPVKFVLNTPPPEPYGQGYYQGSCAAWAIAYGAMSYYFNDEQGYNKLYNKVFSPAFLYNQTKTTNDCNSGLYFETYYDTIGAFNFIMKNGVCKWSDMPYYFSGCNCYNIPDESQIEKAKKYRIKSYYSVNTTSVKTLKNVLYRGDPIIIAVDTDEDFYYLGNEVWKPDYTKEPDGCHAMLIVGYDDNRRAFKILNSYGIYWGDNGYLWLSYDHIECIIEAYVIVPDYSHITTEKDYADEIYYDVEEEEQSDDMYYDEAEEEIDEFELLFD